MMFATVLEWLLERIGLVIFVLIFIGQVVRGLLRARRTESPPEAKPDELEAERREKEIQEDIRRRRAARRGASVPVEPPPLAPREPALPPSRPRPETTQMPEPLGAPLRRVLEELQREMRPAPPPPIPAVRPVQTEQRNAERRNAELERQERLAEQVRSVEETRILVNRRAAHRAADKVTEAQSETGLRSAARAKLLDELHDRESLRRAFVLREVLGPPVGLR
jgi:hypothetical protein